jgi:hypothetical protein
VKELPGARKAAEIFNPPFSDVIFPPQVIDWTEYLTVDACSVGRSCAAAVAAAEMKKPIF